MFIKDLYNVISDNVRYYRINNLKYGYVTQEKLSRLSKVSISLIRNIEAKNKSNVINLVALNNIANALDIPVYKFLIKNNS